MQLWCTNAPQYSHVAFFLSMNLHDKRLIFHTFFSFTAFACTSPLSVLFIISMGFIFGLFYSSFIRRASFYRWEKFYWNRKIELFNRRTWCTATMHSTRRRIYEHRHQWYPSLFQHHNITYKSAHSRCRQNIEQEKKMPFTRTSVLKPFNDPHWN